MATNWLGIDLPQTFGSVLQTKAGMNELADRKAAQEREARAAPLRVAAAGGDRNALTELAGFAPDDAKQILDFIGKLDEKDRQALKDQNEAMGRAAAMVLQSDNPAATYADIRKRLPASARQNAPEQYDPNFVQYALSKAMTLDKMLATPTVKTVGTEDRVFNQFGQETERTTSQGERNRQTTERNALRTDARVREGWNRADARKLMGSGGGGAGGGGLSTADENFFSKAAGTIVGGEDTLLGGIKFTDENQAARAQAIASAGVQIYQESGGAMTRQQAMAQAARLAGIPVDDLMLNRVAAQADAEGGDNALADGNGNLSDKQLLELYGGN